MAAPAHLGDVVNHASCGSAGHSDPKEQVAITVVSYHPILVPSGLLVNKLRTEFDTFE